ncbi:hypothetical protein [Kitasatospora purpeofusca]|uniref:hypothetical protein n=1 Tax=Kitasatospora purpeofusca TaxID=67352 RepID=UPI0004C1D6CA|nr:hypothetical protein [Kitasatospora purpeofusca]
MSRKATRRPTTVRTLAGAILTVALIVPVATACGPDSDASATASGTASAAPVATVPTTAPPAPAGTATTAPPTAAPVPTTAVATPTTTKPTTPSTTPTAKPKSPGRSYPLVDGSTAEVQPVGNQNYTARILSRGSVLATLETKDADAGLDANDMFVVLSVDGTVHSWMGGAHQGPGTFKLAGGWTAKVTKVGELHYRAQILGLDNAVNDTLDADQHDTGAVANGVYIVLTAGGRISAHM